MNQEGKKVKTEVVQWKYVFGEGEKRDIAQSLAQKQIDKLIVEDEKKSIMSGYKDRLDRFSLDINVLSRHLIDGYRMQDFERRIEKDFDAHVKKFFDIHSGFLIATRPLDPSDYQQEMDFKK